jgi:nicotinate-nucleotide pyrophosphorylase (carboxylating)
MKEPLPPFARRILQLALEEDIGQGDITSNLLFDPGHICNAVLIAKAPLVLAGMPFAREVFRMVSEDITFNPLVQEGERVRRGTVLAQLKGPTKAILSAERVALNILQHLSGIATLTRAFVSKLKGLKARITDTRKTIPCMRYLEKYAVRVGGGVNHRMGLYDGLLIKDNHIEALGSLAEAVSRARQGGYLSRVEVEVENLKEFQEALRAGADVIMLDNMSLEDMAEAVRLNRSRAVLEASGNITLENVRAVAETGVDFISIGALTHSARAADISLKLLR